MATGNHYSCSMTAVLLAEVRRWGGEQAVGELLDRAGSARSPEYLTDIANWVSYDEANALWEAATRLTQRPYFSRRVGEQAARQLASSPVAALLRSLGSPEALYRQMSVTASKFSTVSRLEEVEAHPGYAEITAVGVNGFQRSMHHCEWTQGLLSCATELYGLPPALVEHEECAALGAELCRYRVTWDADGERRHDGSSEQLTALQEQLNGMKERLRSMFATASDLIAADAIEEVLARITDRAAHEVRAPRYLLAVRLESDGELHCHHRGFSEDDVPRYAELLLDGHPAEFPGSWLVVSVASNRCDYGRLMASFDTEGGFFPQERELFEVYARYAANALDSAASLREAKRSYDESSALLKLARTLASAGTSQEVAQRLADAVPLVVDCDRVSVSLWDSARQTLVRRALATTDPDDPLAATDPASRLAAGGPVERLLSGSEPEPVFVDAEHGDPLYREEARRMGDVAAVLVPIATPGAFLGLLRASVRDRPQRLAPTEELLHRVTGVAAQATTALQKGRLIDQITHQATHDQLTGLANRLRFTDELQRAISRARECSGRTAVFYIDLDGFKPVNDGFGHDAGDRLLSVVGRRLAGCMRSGDLVARLGGDEFAVLVPDAGDGGEVELVAKRLAAMFGPPFQVDGHELRVGASIGSAIFPADASTASELLRRADEAMFAVKHVAQTARREAQASVTHGGSQPPKPAASLSASGGPHEPGS
jgi:diguanylate cyclase (GGDEF)-like protein